MWSAVQVEVSTTSQYYTVPLVPVLPGQAFSPEAAWRTSHCASFTVFPGRAHRKQKLWFLSSSPSQQQSVRRQGSLAFSLFGVLLAHGDLRNNKLSQLAVNLWNLSHKHGYCETRVSVSFSLTHSPPALEPVSNPAVSSLLCRFGPWSPSNTRPSSPTWPTWPTRCRGWPCSPAPEQNIHTVCERMKKKMHFGNFGAEHFHSVWKSCKCWHTNNVKGWCSAKTAFLCLMKTN